jgi:molybdate transport system ATP-binding protein
MSTLSLDVKLERPGFTLRVEHDFAFAGITALFGPSGSGKSTLLRVIAGLEREARGRVTYDGEAWQSERLRVPAHRRRIGFVFQDSRLFPHLTVEQNLRFGWQRVGRDSAARPALGLDATIEALDLKSLLPRRTPSLSGGEQQRVAIARALLASPRLMLMDEPLSSLDVARKTEILPHIEKLPATFRVPVLYVTHNVEEVVRLASQVVLLTQGRVTAHGAVAEIFERTDLFAFTGGLEAGSVLRTEVTAYHDGVATLRVGSQQLRVPMGAVPVGTSRQIRIHARDVAIATLRPQQLSIRNVLVARILRIEAGRSPNVELTLDVDGEHLRSRITRDAREELGLATGQQVFALIKSVALESPFSA